MPYISHLSDKYHRVYPPQDDASAAMKNTVNFQIKMSLNFMLVLKAVKWQDNKKSANVRSIRTKNITRSHIKYHIRQTLTSHSEAALSIISRRIKVNKINESKHNIFSRQNHRFFYAIIFIIYLYSYAFLMVHYPLVSVSDR